MAQVVALRCANDRHRVVGLLSLSRSSELARVGERRTCSSLHHRTLCRNVWLPTIYFLTSALPLEIPLVHSSGHLWATLLGYGTVGAAVEMAIGSIFIVAGLLLIIKGWARIYFSGDRLQTTGIYGIIRHPQYSGIFLAILASLFTGQPS